MAYGQAVANALDCMRNEKKYYGDYIPDEAILCGDMLVQALKDSPDIENEKICNMLLSKLPYEHPHSAVWWYSVICRIEKRADIFEQFVYYIREHEEAFSKNTLFYLFYQLKSLAFRFADVESYTEKRELWKLYLDIVEKFATEVNVSLEYIPENKRNRNQIVVIAEQFLDAQHGPTKVVLDCCKAIQSTMGKEVLLINTAEICSNVGKIPFYKAYKGNHIFEKKVEKYQEWKGARIPYFQCDQNMPDLDTINHLLLEFREMAPGRVVAIGGSGMLANLANKMIPVITMGLSSDLEYTSSAYQTLSRKITDTDRTLIQELGFTEKHIVERIPTSSLKPQTEKITKKDLGIEENKYLLTVVGWRLDDEVTDEFLSMLEPIMDDNMVLGFLGPFKRFEEKVAKYPNLKRNSKLLGCCDDTLSRMEVCDLYINPLRKGGGTSCVEAMYMGVPVVTIAYGDVALNAGKDFCVADYKEMQKKILQYYQDKQYYKEMSALARKRTEVLLDAEGEVVRILNEVDKREFGC